MISYGVLSLVGEVIEQASSTLMEVEITSEEAEVKVDARITAESAVMSVILAMGIKIAKRGRILLCALVPNLCLVSLTLLILAILSGCLAVRFNIDLCMTFGILDLTLCCYM